MPVTADSVRLRLLLDAAWPTVDRLLAEGGVEAVWLFGSVARGDAGPSSDIDLFVEFRPGVGRASMFMACSGLMVSLGEAIGVAVDVVCEELGRPEVVAAAHTERVWVGIPTTE